jgi:hypothetical protein
MTASRSQHVFLCNEASKPANIPEGWHVKELRYSNSTGVPNVRLHLPKFVNQVHHLPDRVLDLLELAAYVFAADRLTLRGARDAVEFHSWLRSMHFVVKVRDHDFWNQPEVQEKLCAVLRFMTGDHQYSFEFIRGHKTPPAGLFDREECVMETKNNASVVLFSGGLDSLGGALERLAQTEEDVFLVSHRSGQPSTGKTQKALVNALSEMYQGRVHHFQFECGLTHVHGADETQRTRAFLFGSIAFALQHCLGVDSFYAYENGVTSINMLRRQDLINARASRTTHPQTHALMAEFLAELHGDKVSIHNPFLTKSKTDVFSTIDRLGGRNFISSAVSCSETYKPAGPSTTHCGCCFQCIDRRIAAYASGLHQIDNSGLYATDLFVNRIPSEEIKTAVLDYIRQGISFMNASHDDFIFEWLYELSDVVPFFEMDEEMAMGLVYELCNHHGQQVFDGLSVARTELDDLRFPLEKGSLLDLLSLRAHLESPSSGKNSDEETNSGIHKDIRHLANLTENVKNIISSMDSKIDVVKKHVQNVPLLQQELDNARLIPEEAALEFFNRIADILEPEEQEIWRAMRNAGGVQKDALIVLRDKNLVKSTATLSRRVKSIDEKLNEHGLPPCNASGPVQRAKKSGGFRNSAGEKIPEDLYVDSADWANDDANRETTIRMFLRASAQDKEAMKQIYLDIEDEAKEYLTQYDMKSN